MSLPQAAVYFQTAYGIADTEDKIIEDINEIAASFYINEVKLKEGVKTVLDKLKQKNVKMCVATATDKGLIEKALERNGIRDYFEAVLTCTDVGAYAVKTAKEDGFPVAAVYDPSAEKEEPEIWEISDFYFRSFNEMESYLNEKSSYDSGL